MDSDIFGDEKKRNKIKKKKKAKKTKKGEEKCNSKQKGKKKDKWSQELDKLVEKKIKEMGVASLDTPH